MLKRKSQQVIRALDAIAETGVTESPLDQLCLLMVLEHGASGTMQALSSREDVSIAKSFTGQARRGLGRRFSRRRRV